MSVYGNEGAEVDPASVELDDQPVDLLGALLHSLILASEPPSPSCVDPWAHEDGRCDQTCRRDA